MSNVALLFPGQGAQVVGMGKDVAGAFPQANAVYQAASRILGYDLASVCFEGPAERINRTAVAQPAILVTSLAILEAVKTLAGDQGLPRARACAGLSLGEYTALAAAGVMGFEDAVRLVHVRGQAMEAAAQAQPGGMVSIIGLDLAKVEALCKQAGQGQLLVPANINCPGQVVISGARPACERAIQLAAEYGAIKAVRLEVSGAFHSPMMSPAARPLAEALEGCKLHRPGDISVVSNMTGQFYSSTQDVKRGLVGQLTSPVLWQACMERLLAAGIDTFIEVGPGRVLAGLMRRIDRRARATSVGNLAGLEAIRSFLAG